MPAKKNTQNHTDVQQKNTTKKKNNQKCCDNKTEFACDNCKLTDYDIISDVLGSHKSLVKLYGTALCETDNENLRKLINARMTECAQDQYDAFIYMNERGMYKVEPAPVQKVKSARTKFGKNIEKFGTGASKIK